MLVLPCGRQGDGVRPDHCNTAIIDSAHDSRSHSDHHHGSGCAGNPRPDADEVAAANGIHGKNAANATTHSDHPVLEPESHATDQDPLSGVVRRAQRLENLVEGV